MDIYRRFPPEIRIYALALRDIVLQTAEETPGVGPLSEEIKWGEPAFLTKESGSGSTIRLGWKPRAPEKVGLYFNCRTRLVDEFWTLFSEQLTFSGNRAIIVDLSQDPRTLPLQPCISRALTYHRTKRRARSGHDL